VGRIRTVFLTLFILAICLVALPRLSAQAVGTILGTITDTSGAVVPNAAVKITNLQTGQVRIARSNSSGNYIAPALPPGRYTVEAEMQGFRKATFKDVELQVDQAARIDIVFQLGSMSEAVVVTGEAPVLNTESPALGQVIENARVVSLPLNGRQCLELTLQVPGVVSGNGGPQSRSSTLFQRPGQNSSISVSGGRSQNNGFLLDGVQNTDPDVNAYIISPSVDTIQEFKMETKNYSAQFGRSSGGQISVVTKSGTNQFHGSAYDNVLACIGFPHTAANGWRSNAAREQMEARMAQELLLYAPDIVSFCESVTRAAAERMAKMLGMHATASLSRRTPHSAALHPIQPSSHVIGAAP
jgi:Carboxypeptidase regulatory-like domain